MKKVLSFIVVLFIFIPVFTTVTEASTFREVKRVQEATPLRIASSPSADIKSTLPTGTLVTQFSTVTGGWSYVQANNQKGYVATNALFTPKSTIKIASSKSGLVVKETATTNSKTVASLKYNMIVEDFGTVGGGWSFVQYGNVTGYINSNFISGTKPTKKYTNASVILRNIASPSGETKGSLNMNAEVYFHSQIVGWSYITSGSLRGYVPSSQLSSSKEKVQPQILKTSTHLRPSNISWMEYYLGMVDEEPKGVLSGYLESDIFENGYSYVPSIGLDWYPPYMLFLTERFAMGMPNTDWSWANIPTPLVQNKPTPIYEMDWEELVEVQVGNAFLRTTTGSITTPAGTFNNVVHIEVKSFSTSVTVHFYFSPGYGLIKIRDSKNKLLFELRDYK